MRLLTAELSEGERARSKASRAKSIISTEEEEGDWVGARAFARQIVGEQCQRAADGHALGKM